MFTFRFEMLRIRFLTMLGRVCNRLKLDVLVRRRIVLLVTGIVIRSVWIRGVNLLSI